ncbi:MAG: biopolymer transporter ExbD [Proteobacteria bacterium]|jgi:biopolymer transport protein ExbD|nr:biopolymer transporter ExbD [Pseudomonadota bacterium]
MKRMNRMRQEEDTKIDITPMLDVVFIMLIFFIVTASFIKESGANVTKPDATTDAKYPRASVLIAVDSNDEIWLDKRQIDSRAIKANISRLRAENPDGEVLLQADIESTAATVMAVIDGLKASGIEVPVISTVGD